MYCFLQYAMKELLDFFELPQESVELLKKKAKEKLKILANAGKEKIATAFAKHKVRKISHFYLNLSIKVIINAVRYFDNFYC